MDELTQRVQQAAASILENEALTANLDDEAGQALLDWGVAYAKTIAQATAGLDEAAAAIAMAEKLKATRHLLRAINQRFDPTTVAALKANAQAMAEANANLLQQTVEQAAIILGSHFAKPAAQPLAAFAAQMLDQVDTPLPLIADLRSFIEEHSAPQAPTEPIGQGVCADEGAPVTVASAGASMPVQDRATSAAASTPTQQYPADGKPTESIALPASAGGSGAPVDPNDKTEETVASQPLPWLARLVRNFRQFLQRSQNPS